jgi:hypothetical protein
MRSKAPRPGKSTYVWQEQFFDQGLRAKDSLAEKADYVCQNPVRAGLGKAELCLSTTTAAFAAARPGQRPGQFTSNLAVSTFRYVNLCLSPR